MLVKLAKMLIIMQRKRLCRSSNYAHQKVFFVVVVVVIVVSWCFFLAKSEKASFFKGPDIISTIAQCTSSCVG